MARKKKKLLPNASEAWKWWSVQLSAIIAAFSAAYAGVEAFKDLMEPTTYAWIVAGGNVLLIFLRTLNQGRQA